MGVDDLSSPSPDCASIIIDLDQFNAPFEFRALYIDEESV